MVQQHEFGRRNIEELEPMEKDYFAYNKDNVERRYDSLKFEGLFRFESTYKAIRWGIGIGSIFAAHRYYRSRNIHNAAHWFSVVSSISFINVWLSYSLQEFVTEYASRGSLIN